jgi:hypothetical protein
MCWPSRNQLIRILKNFAAARRHFLADVNPLTMEWPSNSSHLWRKSRTEAALTLHESDKWQSVPKVGNV